MHIEELMADESSFWGVLCLKSDVRDRFDVR